MKLLMVDYIILKNLKYLNHGMKVKINSLIKTWMILINIGVVIQIKLR